ncbi:hypothetical protein [Kitasatospora sp. NPDC002040]|uniref:Imm32 family immunity protein n=1 Tax=Kitasatospora sp. NPDC002040 TaxID=3154661 RepID=UPI0033264ED3
MQLKSDRACTEILISGSAAELTLLAEAVAAGEGFLAAVTEPGSGTPTGIGAERAPGPGVLVRIDTERRLLLISGDDDARAVLAANLRGIATADEGGHLHIDYYPDHYYLVEGSVPLVVESPHGGMPHRR